jgi:hypothetical protein
MAYRTEAVLVLAGALFATGVAPAQDPTPQAMPSPQAMQVQIQRIAQERPREAEAAARAFLHVISMQRGQGPVEPNLAMLEQLKTGDPDAYWREVAQLTVQFDMVQNLVRRDSVRAGLVTQMFGLELMARTLQRAYRATVAKGDNQPLIIVDGILTPQPAGAVRGGAQVVSPSTQQQQIRAQLTTLIATHFDFENQLRLLEMKDIERRLAEVRAETQRRIDKKSEFVKWAVDDIVRDALRPR